MTCALVSPKRFALLTFVVGAFFACLAGRLVFLHVVDGERAQRVAEKTRQRFETLSCRRGDITDARGHLLATTRTVMELGVDPDMIRPADVGVGAQKDGSPNPDKVPELAALIGMDAPTLRSLLAQKYREDDPTSKIRWRKLVEKIDEPTYEKVMALGIKGVYGNRKFERVYPGDALASHLLGYVNKEGISQMGIERFMDFYLRGQDGWRLSERDGRRRELAQFRSRQVDPANGLNVELSIDMALQDIAESELRRLVQEHDPKGASIIISDPKTGFVLAMANYPTFDPNRYWDFPIESLKNRAVTDVFEPGSTFKIVAASGALNERIVKPTDRFNCALTSMEYKGRIVGLPKEDHAMGVLEVSQIVSKSSNRGSAQLGMLLGEQRLYNYASAFGFGARAGLGSALESPGMLHPVKAWDGLTITRLPMGHAVSATPLQVHYAMSVIANGGVLMQPQLVKRVYDAQGNTLFSYEAHSKRRVISPDIAATVSRMLVDVVDPKGTARRAAVEGYKIAGKTGTTQKIVDGKYSSTRHVASFVGFLPAENPRLVISVIVDEAKARGGVSYGGLISAPAFHNVAMQSVRYLGIQPEDQFRNMLAWENKVP